MDLSIVIVNYNAENLLKQCLESIYKNTQGLDFEVIVVDNASMDGSVEMVRSDFPKVLLIISQENEGFSRANNKGIKKSKGEFVALLNPDTIIQKETFIEMISFMRQNKKIGMVGPKLVRPNGKLDLACHRSFPRTIDGFYRAVGLSSLFPRSKIFARYNLTYLNEDESAEVDAICGAFMLVRRKAIEEVGFLDEEYFMYGEDLDWCYRFMKAGWIVCYYPKASVIHIKGSSTVKESDKMIKEFFKSMKLFYKKHYAIQNSFLVNIMNYLGIEAWRTLTLIKNFIRKEKRVTP